MLEKLMLQGKARAYRAKVPRTSTMALCKSKLWLFIISLFTIWSLMICLNYSSLIDSVASIAKFYVYSVDNNIEIPVINNPGDTSIIVGGGGGGDIDSEKTGDYDEIDKLLEVNINELIKIDKKEADRVEDNKKEVKQVEEKQKEAERIEDNKKEIERIEGDTKEAERVEVKSVRDQIVVENKEPRRENPQQNRTPRKKKKRGKSKRRKPLKRLQNVQIHDQNFNHNVGVVKSNSNASLTPQPPRMCKTGQKPDPKSCEGRYIFMHTLPRRFNVDLLRDCKSLDLWMDMCLYVKNFGLGPELSDVGRVFSPHGWFGTNQFLLEVIFHNRMKQYDCLTNDPSKATAIFVPFYAGLDVARHLWNTDSSVRDSGGLELVRLLKRKPEWKTWFGRDHFFVAGRITWDFRRSSNKDDPDWGTKFLYLPETKNMTGLVIESSPWNGNDFGIPYPTYFHPGNDAEVFQWQNRMRNQSRINLFSFAGAPRPDRPDSIRNQLITQCQSSNKCMLIHCNNWKNKCHKPAELIKMFQTSVFCLQPPGDSYTRRSIFDSILAGCIPVFFHPGSAYIQYLWHFPKEYTKYSVFIPMYEVRDGKVNIQKVLENIPKQKVDQMKEEVINLIPKVVYADPRCKLETIEDAFDASVNGVLERVRRIKEDMKEGRDDSFGYDEKQAWKYRWVGKFGKHEWDPYFSGSFDTRNFSNF